MRYLCLVHHREDRAAGLGAEARQALEEECRAYEERLRRSGHLLTGHRLEPDEVGTVVRVRGGRLSVTSREPTEAPIGLFVLEARDLNEAILVAAQHPLARAGAIEIRPVRDAL